MLQGVILGFASIDQLSHLPKQVLSIRMAEKLPHLNRIPRLRTGVRAGISHLTSVRIANHRARSLPIRPIQPCQMAGVAAIHNQDLSP